MKVEQESPWSSDTEGGVGCFGNHARGFGRSQIRLAAAATSSTILALSWCRKRHRNCMSFKDVTHGVKRMEILEERMGIRLQGFMATVANEITHDGTHELQVNGEIYSTSEGALDQALELQVFAQHEKGQVVGVSTIYLECVRE